MCHGGAGGGAEVAKPKVAVCQGLAGGEEELATSSGELAVCGADVNLAIEAVGLTVLCRLSVVVGCDA